MLFGVTMDMRHWQVAALEFSMGFISRMVKDVSSQKTGNLRHL